MNRKQSVLGDKRSHAGMECETITLYVVRKFPKLGRYE